MKRTASRFLAVMMAVMMLVQVAPLPVAQAAPITMASQVSLVTFVGLTGETYSAYLATGSTISDAASEVEGLPGQYNWPSFTVSFDMVVTATAPEEATSNERAYFAVRLNGDFLLLSATEIAGGGSLQGSIPSVYAGVQLSHASWQGNENGGFSETGNTARLSSAAQIDSYSQGSRHFTAYLDGAVADFYTVTLIDSATHAAIQAKTVLKGTTLGRAFGSLPAEHNGRAIDHWETAAGGAVSGDTAIDGQLVLTPVYDTTQAPANELYAVEFRSEDRSVLYGTVNLTASEGTATLKPTDAPVAAADGYVFANWRTLSGQLWSGLVDYTITGNTTFLAVFAPEDTTDLPYTVEFYESTEANTPIATQKVAEGGAVTAFPFVEDREGYAFVGWDVPDAITAENTVNGVFKAYPLYDPLVVYSIEVHYAYSDGQKAADSIKEYYLPGEKVSKTYNANTPKGYALQAGIDILVVNAVAGEAGFEQNIVYHYVYEPSDEIEYWIYHVREDFDGNFETEDIVPGKGKIGDLIEPVPKTYEGFTFVSADEGYITLEGDNIFYVRYSRNSYVMTFDSMGGTYVEPQVYRYEEYVWNRDINATKTGYVLMGWKDKDGNFADIPKLMPAEDLTYYAAWDAIFVEYQIVVWYEKANLGTAEAKDLKADFVSYASLAATAKAGGTVIEADAKGIAEGVPNAIPPYSAFYKTDAEVTVAGDGSTVINLYYRRAVYTLVFNLGTPKRGEGVAAVSPTTMDMGGDTYSLGGTKYQINVKYEMDISDIWPSTTNAEFFGKYRIVPSITRDANFTGWLHPDNAQTGHITHRMIATKDLLSTTSTTIEYTARWHSKTDTCNVTYYIEALPEQENEATRRIGEVGYVINPAYTESFEATSERFSAKDIDGVEHVKTETSGQSPNFYYELFYTRNRYTITFDLMGSSKNIPSVTVMYGQPITAAQEPATPADKHNNGVAYKFAGWYLDPDYNEAFAFDGKYTMPSSNLILFAKWEDVKVSITYVSNGETLKTVEYNAGDKVEDYTPNNNEGNVFLGWYAENQSPFIPGSLLYHDTTVYAKWLTGHTSYTVMHVFYDEEGNPVDESEVKTTYPNAEIGRLYSAKALQSADYIADQLFKSMTTVADAAANLITFHYYPVENRLIQYTIYYQDAAGKDIIPPKTLDNIENGKYVAKVEASYAQIDGYTPNVYQITRWLTTNEDENKIVFVYTPNEAIPYTVRHLLQQTPGIASYRLADTDSKTGLIGTTTTYDQKNYPGYTFKRVLNVQTITGVKTITVDLYYDCTMYTVSYYLDGVLQVGMGNQHAHNATVTVEPFPVGSGLVIDGWYENDTYAGGAKAPGSTFAMPLGDVSLYAYTTQTPKENVTIHYQVAAASEGMGVVKNSKDELNPDTGIANGSKAEPGPGYEFVGWVDEDGGTVSTEPEYVPGRPAGGWVDGTTYYALFKRLTDILIQYVPVTDGTVNSTAGGDVSPRLESGNPQTGPFEGSVATKKAGYAFRGWAADAEGTRSVETAEALVPQPKAGLYEAATYYAQFAMLENITIEYIPVTDGKVNNTDGGTVSPGDETGNPETGPFTGSTAAVKAGYEFLGWTTDAEGTNSAGQTAQFTPQRENGTYKPATYYAQFRKTAVVEDITIRYVPVTDGEVNNTDGGTVSPAEETGNPETGPFTGSTAAVKAGYEFLGWTTDAEGTNGAGQTAQFIPQPENGTYKPATYYAQFRKTVVEEDITIRYVPVTNGTVNSTAGGTVTPTEETGHPETGLFFGSIALAASGYDFLGWSTSADPATASNPGAASFVPQAVEGVHQAAVYYAHFRAQTPATATIHYQVRSGVGTLSVASETLSGNSAAAGSTAQPGTGYFLARWEDAAGNVLLSGQAHYTPAMPAGGWVSGTTYYAVFERSSYTLTVHHYWEGTTQSVYESTTVTRQFGDLYNESVRYGRTDASPLAPYSQTGAMPAYDLTLYFYYDQSGGSTGTTPTPTPEPDTTPGPETPPVVTPTDPNPQISVEYTQAVQSRSSGGLYVLSDYDIPLAGMGASNMGDCVE